MNLCCTAFFVITVLCQLQFVTAIFSGAPAKVGELPFMVQLERIQAYNKLQHYEYGTFWCGGTILSENVVLTAAHCVPNFGIGSAVKVKAGGIRKGDYEESTSQVRLVQGIIIHETYEELPKSQGSTPVNDLAILILNYPLKWSKSVGPIKILKTGQIFEENGQICGFGKMGENQVVTTTLQKTGARIVPGFQCLEDIRGYVGNVTFWTADQIICAKGHAGGAVCSGDSGSPLICYFGTEPYVCGIASTTIGKCGEYDVPGVFTPVANFSEWLHDRILEFTFHCVPEEFNCGDGTCIPLALQCDNKTQCAMGTDEIDCWFANQSIPPVGFELNWFGVFSVVFTAIGLGFVIWQLCKFLDTRFVPSVKHAFARLTVRGFWTRTHC